MRVHRACRDSLAGTPQLANAGGSLGTESDLQKKGDIEALGEGFFGETNTNATHPKQAE